MTIRSSGCSTASACPARAMTLDAILNIFLITYFAGVLRDPRREQHRLRVRDLQRARRLPAAAQGPAELAAPGPPVRTAGCRSARCCSAINSVLLIAGGFIYSGGFLGITGYGYGWDKTRTGLLVLLAAFILYVWRHVVQDKIPLKLREEVPQTPEDERGTPSSRRPAWRPRVADAMAGPQRAASWAGGRACARYCGRSSQRGRSAIACR